MFESSNITTLIRITLSTDSMFINEVMTKKLKMCQSERQTSREISYPAVIWKVDKCNLKQVF